MDLRFDKLEVVSKYAIGDKLLLKTGRVVEVKGVHIYISAQKIGYHLHIGKAVFISEKDIKRRL